MSVRKEYQRELEGLHERIIKMGAAVEEAIDLSAEALATYQVSLCQQVVAGDDLIDAMEREINKECILLIARQQPVARDLRDIMANLKLITDLERIADHAEDICVHVLEMVKQRERVTVPHDVMRLASLSRQMIGTALDAYVSRSREKAVACIQMDDQVDELYWSCKDYLKRQMKLDPEEIGGYVELLMVIKHFERCADHAENVAEWVVYYLDGSLSFLEALEAKDG